MERKRENLKCEDVYDRVGISDSQVIEILKILSQTIFVNALGGVGGGEGTDLSEMRWGGGKWTEDISDLLTKMQTRRQTLQMSVSQGFILESAVLIDSTAVQAQSNQKKKFVEIDGSFQEANHVC